MKLEQLQAEVSAWSTRNFPNNRPHHPLLGIIEEIGEFFASKTREDEEDAIADALIYCADYAARNGLMLTEPVDSETHFSDEAIGRLSHYHLKGEQGIRYTPEQITHHKQEALRVVVHHIIAAAEMQDIDWREAVVKTWAKVKQRDWQKNPLNAAAIVGN
jgi:NTP pyrophosphatase (non-canonical NTP hydrolase)